MKRGFLLTKAQQRAASTQSAEESVSPEPKRKAKPPPRVSAAVKRHYPHLEHACGRPLLLLQASLGPSLFLTPTPAKARCLVIDCAHRNTRRMWEAVSLEAAYQWGMAARTLEKIVIRYPKPAVSRRERSNAPMWCMGMWVAILEGHAHGRQRAVAVKNKADKKGKGEMEATGSSSSSSSSSQAASVAACDGSLRVLEFEAVDMGGPQEWENEDDYNVPCSAPSSQPLPPKTDGGVPPRILPVHLPALTEVRNMPVEVAAVRMDRSWHTPGIRVFTVGSHRIYPSVELLSWARTKSPFLERHVEELARIVPRVTYQGRPEPHQPAATAMTRSTFPRADCFHLAAYSLTRYTMRRAVSVATAIGKTYIRVSGEEGEDAAPRELAVEFLKALQAARLNEGSETALDVHYALSLGGEDVGSLWETHAVELSPIRCLELWITDTFPPGA
ncbi:unnamed protein product [Vitrella brassicaformis CCMP3155]|uniref:Uncharacterized protein n=1 Tax=Vitrella brassicaformis (strain CCMP3155) TaxID=1169540 RepID=A0A0G4G168_VITBC|nr:unnamed protein product [Vitrella brassicaformis CCMP3155]|eukprot:CEM21834.1 unnamed protein product [Vitrella brassicaformis CCMP3155]